MEHFFSPSSGEDRKKSFHQNWGIFFSRILVKTCAQMHTQARSQKFAMGGLSWGSGGGAPSRQRPTGAGGGALSARKVCIFLQKLLNFRAFLIKNNAIKTWHRNWQRNMIQLVALMGCMGSG